MDGLPPTLEKVIEGFSKFPGIGKKTAHRLGLHVLKTHTKDVEDFAQALLNVKSKLIPVILAIILLKLNSVKSALMKKETVQLYVFAKNHPIFT